MKVTAVVPSYKPDEKLSGVIAGLRQAGFERIILVDDGSGEAYQELFRQAQLQPGCVLLRQEQNGGKGKALKTAFSWFLEHCQQDVGVVTVDGDGQHDPEDAARCALALEESPDSLVLGVRRFDGREVPFRSAFGNKITVGCFRFLCGVRVSDTQTGLRAIGRDFLRALLEVPGDRYEYETNMLLATSRLGIPIREVPIHTVYLEQNATSHFNPLKDSWAIYQQIFRFLSVSLGSTAVDVALFLLVNWLLKGMRPELRLLWATAVARIISSLCNFTANRTLVFASRERPGPAMARYYTLCVAQAAASYGGVYLLSAVFPLPAAAAKIITDTLLFLASFQIQRQWVFAHRKISAKKKEETVHD